MWTSVSPCRICSKHVYWMAGLMVSSRDAPIPLYRGLQLSTFQLNLGRF